MFALCNQSIGGHLACLQSFAITNNGAMNSLVHTSFGLFTTATMGTILRSELLSQTVNAIYCQITLDGIYTIDILHSHQQCMKAHISPQPSQQNTL